MKSLRGSGLGAAVEDWRSFTFFAFICLLFGIFVFNRIYKAKVLREEKAAAEAAARAAWERRRADLISRFGEQDADRILAQRIWQGMTVEQLHEAIGAPVEVSRRVFKTKISETHKYVPTRKNRFNMRVMLEDGAVVTWDKK
jgi:hypothetical protein